MESVERRVAFHMACLGFHIFQTGIRCTVWRKPVWKESSLVLMALCRA